MTSQPVTQPTTSQQHPYTQTQPTNPHPSETKQTNPHTQTNAEMLLTFAYYGLLAIGLTIENPFAFHFGAPNRLLCCYPACPSPFFERCRRLVVSVPNPNHQHYTQNFNLPTHHQTPHEPIRRVQPGGGALLARLPRGHAAVGHGHRGGHHLLHVRACVHGGCKQACIYVCACDGCDGCVSRTPRPTSPRPR